MFEGAVMFNNTFCVAAFTLTLVGAGGTLASAAPGITQVDSGFDVRITKSVDWDKVAGVYNSPIECQNSLRFHPAGTYCTPGGGNSWVAVVP